MSWPFFVCRSVRTLQEPDVAEKSYLHRHTDAIQIPLWMKEGDSLTLPYTQYGVYVTVDLRKTILPVLLLIHNPTLLRKLGTSRTSSNKPDYSTYSLVLQNIAPLSPNSMHNLDWSLKMTFNHCSDVQSLCVCACLPTEAALTCACG